MELATIFPIVAKFLNAGVAGAVALVAFWWAWRKDRETAVARIELATQARLLAQDKESEIKALYERLHSREIDHLRRYHELTSELNGIIRDFYEPSSEPSLVAVDVIEETIRDPQ